MNVQAIGRGFLGLFVIGVALFIWEHLRGAK